MQFTDLLRMTVLLCGGGASALALMAVLGLAAGEELAPAAVTAAWWGIAVAGGAVLGAPERAAEAVRPMLAAARTATQLPDASAGRLALSRLWPIAAFVLIAGGAGVVFPQIAGIGAGFLLAVALAWRNREPAVLGIEERDGVCFYVLPGSAFEPVKLMRTPGLTRDRDPGGAMPPPPAGA
jgi:hypothetical protein